MQIPSILLLGFVYVAYVLIGGVVFWKLEGDLGQKDVSYLLEKKERLLSTYPCLNQAGLEAVAQVRNKNVEMKQTVSIHICNLWLRVLIDLFCSFLYHCIYILSTTIMILHFYIPLWRQSTIVEHWKHMLKLWMFFKLSGSLWIYRKGILESGTVELIGLRNKCYYMHLYIYTLTEGTNLLQFAFWNLLFNKWLINQFNIQWLDINICLRWLSIYWYVLFVNFENVSYQKFVNLLQQIFMFFVTIIWR